MRPLHVLQRVPPWPVLAAMALALCGLVFIGSATFDDVKFAGQQTRQALFLATSFGIGGFLILPHYVHVLRTTWPFYVLTVLGLLGLPYFAPELNGSRRWYTFPGFSVQPSEFAKLAVVLALASLLRFPPGERGRSGLGRALLVAGLPALLVLRQPDLGSSLVFAPVLLAVCFAAGVPRRKLLLLLGVAVVVGAIGFAWLHEYQQRRVSVWWQHWEWTDERLGDPVVRQTLRSHGYQPWQALIALGGGGLTGFGLQQGPQNRYDFLPYRSEDYVFAVVGEETGWIGCMVVMGLVGGVVFGILQIAARTRERYGRLVCVGVATWLGAQSVMHVAVCGWLVPSTGLPMPLVSYGGSGTLAAVIGIAICANIGARREPILAADGFR